MNSINIDEQFFGRQSSLELLERRILDLKDGYRQNVALLGNKYVGKSSLFYRFLTRFDDPDVTTIYLDLENKDFNYFFHKFVTTLLYNFSKSQHLPLHEDLNLLLESVKSRIPHTVQVIRKIQAAFEGKKLADCFLGLLTLPEIFTNESGKFCVLILDEFQNIEDYPIPNIFQELGKKIMTQKRCLYIVASSYPSLAKKILAEKLSLLFGNFEIVDVEPFDHESSQKFIEQSIKEHNIGMHLRNFLTDFTGGYPLYLSLICRELNNLSAIYKQSEIYMPLLSQAVENTIFDKWGVISRHFELIINDLCNGKGNRIISSLLIAVSNGKHKLEDVVDEVGGTKHQVRQKLNRLIELRIVVKNGTFFYFKDKLFKYWIKYVYQKRLNDIELSPDRQRKEFRDEFNSCVESFKLTTRKGFSSRIVELLHCFDNESLRLNGRKYKLPIFRVIEPVRVRNEGGKSYEFLKASTGDEIWFIVMKKDSFVESDVTAVLAEVKNIEEKPERCVIISLANLDEGTRVRALQERFWIWNERELNTLLTLFDKPFILK